MRSEGRRRKLLLLESDWRGAADRPPTQTRSAARLYAALGGLLSTPARPLECLRRPLLADSLQSELADFVKLPENRRGPNVVVISTHGFYQAPSGHLLAAADGLIEPRRVFAALEGRLHRSLVIMDACQIGADLSALRAGTLGLVGFQGEVDWLASSVFVLALLRGWQRAGVFELQRAHPARAKRVLDSMRGGDYARLMRELGVVYEI
jgi:hypothetical protein